MGIFQKTGDQLELLEQMIERTSGGSGLDMLTASDQDVRSAMFACLGCKNTGACKKWMAGDHTGEAPPAFCPNSERLARLSKS